jgi:hypothetical protein
MVFDHYCTTFSKLARAPGRMRDGATRTEMEFPPEGMMTVFHGRQSWQQRT